MMVVQYIIIFLICSYFLSEIQKGRTPNPDIICNKSIKFSSFYNYAVGELNAWKVATGHYAQLLASSPHTKGEGMVKTTYAIYPIIVPSAEVVKLLQAVDSSKDQTYFLSQVSQVSHVALTLR